MRVFLSGISWGSPVLAAGRFTITFGIKTSCLPISRITVEPLWYTDGKRNSLETFFTCCKDNFLYNGTLKGFGNALSYYGQNDLRSEIENKGVEDLVRLLKWNHFPGAITPELREVLRFFMCGIEKYYLDSKTIQVDWLYTFWINCVPAYLAEYLVKEPE